MKRARIEVKTDGARSPETCGKNTTRCRDWGNKILLRQSVSSTEENGLEGRPWKGVEMLKRSRSPSKRCAWNNPLKVKKSYDLTSKG